MKIILGEKEIKDALSLYLSQKQNTNINICDIKIRRKSRKTEDIGSITIYTNEA